MATHRHDMLKKLCLDALEIEREGWRRLPYPGAKEWGSAVSRVVERFCEQAMTAHCRTDAIQIFQRLEAKNQATR